MVVLRAVAVDAAVHNLRHAEGTETAHQVVVVEDLIVREVVGLLPVADGTGITAVTVGANDRGVAGAEASNAGAITLGVLDAHPPGVERGVKERGAFNTVTEPGVHGREGEDDGGTVKSGAHGSIVPHDRECV